MSKRIKNKEKKDQMTGANYIVIGWAILIFSLFPIVYTDYYFNILETKYIAYTAITGVMLATLLLWGLLSGRMVRYWKEAKSKYMQEDGHWIKSWIKGTWSAMDICAMVFLLIAVISTLQASPYIMQAFLGNEGRHTGLFLLILYVASYLCVSRFFKMKSYVITVFLWVGLFICLFGITDYFNMNIMHFRDRMQVKQYQMFCSTIGNINTYTTFVGFVVAIAGTLFNTSKEWKGRIVFYYVCMVISFVAIIMGQSDNGYLTLIAFFGLLPLGTWRTRRGLRRYVLTLATFLSCIWYVQWANATYPAMVSGLEGIYTIIDGLPYLRAITMGVWMLAIALYIIDYRTKATEAVLPKVVHTVWLVLVVAVVILAVGVILAANTGARDESSWGSLGHYLVFSDQWGTARGYVWRACIQTYTKLPILHQIFGTGPDTFGIYMMNYNYGEMVQITGQIYDSAHNEYLQYLFTIGPIGLIAYLGLLGSTIFMSMKKALASDKAPYLLAISYLIICYAAQATVNINLPISTPIMWAWLSIAVALIREKD